MVQSVWFNADSCKDNGSCMNCASSGSKPLGRQTFLYQELVWKSCKKDLSVLNFCFWLEMLGVKYYFHSSLARPFSDENQKGKNIYLRVSE